MIINIPAILQLSFIHVLRQHLKDIERSYPGKPWIRLFISYAGEELMKIETRAYFPNLPVREDDDEELEQWHKPENAEFYQLACDLKEKLLPADYLFFKALFSEKEENSLFLLQQAHMLEPENARLFLFSSFFRLVIKESELEENKQFMDQMDSVISLSPYKDAVVFSSVFRIIQQMQRENEEIPDVQLNRIKHQLPRMQLVWYSLLYHMYRKKQQRVLELICECLKKEENDRHFLRTALMAMTLTGLGRHDEAIGYYHELFNQEVIASSEFRLEVRYNYSRSLSETGNAGKSVLILREIISEEEYARTHADDYYNAAIDLAKYYCRTSQPGEAARIMALFEDIGDDYGEENWGEDYLLIMAERSLYEDKWEKALTYYRKAFSLSGSKEIEERIRFLEKGMKKD